MNKQQAMCIALATEASYILTGAQTDAICEQLSDDDADRVRQAQKEMAEGMLKRAGFNSPMLADEILTAVLNG